LVVAQQDLLLLTVEIESQNRRMKSLGLQVHPELFVVQFDRLRVLSSPVHDARHFLRVTQAAARTSPLRRTRCCVHFDCHMTSDQDRRPRPGDGLQNLDAPQLAHSMKSELTDSSLLMRSIVSASSSATVS